MSADDKPMDRERFEVVAVEREVGDVVAVTLKGSRVVPGTGAYVTENSQVQFMIRERHAPRIGNVYLVTIEPLPLPVPGQDRVVRR